MYSVIVPVYRNTESLPELVDALASVATSVQGKFGVPLEAVFVVDGSPDDDFLTLERLLPSAAFRSQLILHARNFGSFAAIRTGLKAAQGEFFGVIAADLQEPPELLIDFLSELRDGTVELVVGVRKNRDDPPISRMTAGLFWFFYRSLVVREIPSGGVDVFACNKRVRDELLMLEEANSSLIGLVFWIGFRRKEVPYDRRARKHGRSTWTFRKKLTYLLDSVFAFTDLPIRILAALGILGVVFSFTFGFVVLLARLIGNIDVPGYTPIVLTMTFFGGLNMVGLSIVGAYAWRSYENTKRRPLAIIREAKSFPSAGSHV